MNPDCHPDYKVEIPNVVVFPLFKSLNIFEFLIGIVDQFFAPFAVAQGD